MTQNKLIYEEPVLEVRYLYNVAGTFSGYESGNMDEEDWEDMINGI